MSPTDFGWYSFLRGRAGLEEVNFWRPGGARFTALSPGEPFFFKLKAEHGGRICGFGQFARFAILPTWLAWDSFGEANGVDSLPALEQRLAAFRVVRGAGAPGHRIGCVIVTSPVFFTQDAWVEPPDDWARQIVGGKGYDLEVGEGRRLWRECLDRSRDGANTVQSDSADVFSVAFGGTGLPTLVAPRLGQGAFRIAVLEAYGWRCAVTGEHSLPVVEAGHIRPFAQMGRHEVVNGLPLRRDVHRLFDLGYVAVEPTTMKLAVSDRLRSEYHNGKTYYALAGHPLHLPARPEFTPSREALEWHRESVFIG